jgi:hypothetical protein
MENFYKLGQNYYASSGVRGYLGELVSVVAGASGGAWLKKLHYVGDTGRFGQFMSNGTLDEQAEIEFLGGMGFIKCVELIEWPHELPMKTI